MPVFAALDKVAAVTALDPVLQRLSAAVGKLPTAARDALHGVWLGHPLHPVLAQAPVGTWLSAAVLDGVATLAPSRATPVERGRGRTARGRLLRGTPVVAVRRDDQVSVLADTCSHLAGPLSDGTPEDDCVVCPWHGSAFRLDDGRVRHGPATAPQPRFDVRVADGMVEARVREPEQEADQRASARLSDPESHGGHMGVTWGSRGVTGAQVTCEQADDPKPFPPPRRRR